MNIRVWCETMVHNDGMHPQNMLISIGENADKPLGLGVLYFQTNPNRGIGLAYNLPWYSYWLFHVNIDLSIIYRPNSRLLFLHIVWPCMTDRCTVDYHPRRDAHPSRKNEGNKLLHFTILAPSSHVFCSRESKFDSEPYPNMWADFRAKWCKFQTIPNPHSSQHRKTLPRHHPHRLYHHLGLSEVFFS